MFLLLLGFLGVPVDRGLVGKVKNASYGSPHKHIMVQVCIHIVCESDKISQGDRHVVRENFLDMTIDSTSAQGP